MIEILLGSIGPRSGAAGRGPPTVACGGGACEIPNLQEVKTVEPEAEVA